jgi:hypothetical protein
MTLVWLKGKNQLSLPGWSYLRPNSRHPAYSGITVFQGKTKFTIEGGDIFVYGNVGGGLAPINE